LDEIEQEPPTYKEIGITHCDAHNWQQIAEFQKSNSNKESAVDFIDNIKLIVKGAFVDWLTLIRKRIARDLRERPNSIRLNVALTDILTVI